MTQQSNNFKPRKRSLKKLWKGYDDAWATWKSDQLRGMTTQLCKKEIDAQLKDNEELLENDQ